MPRTASEGPRYLERANHFISQGMKKQEAFRQVAIEELGEDAAEDAIDKKQKSVASTFYRLNRDLSGNGVPKTQSKSKPKPAAKKKPQAKKAEDTGKDSAPPSGPQVYSEGTTTANTSNTTYTQPATVEVRGSNGSNGSSAVDLIDNLIADHEDIIKDLQRVKGTVVDLLSTQSKIEELLG